MADVCCNYLENQPHYIQTLSDFLQEMNLTPGRLMRKVYSFVASKLFKLQCRSNVLPLIWQTEFFTDRQQHKQFVKNDQTIW